MIADCLSCIVCQDTAEDDETLNLHVTTLMMFQDGKLQDIHHQSCRELDADLHTFWIHRFNMHIANGIIMNESSFQSPYNKSTSSAFIWDI